MVRSKLSLLATGLPSTDVTVLDVFENAASAKIVASDWVDYLHLARWNGEWKIVNVLWELKPQETHAQKQK